MEIRTEKVTFPSSINGMLAARIDRPMDDIPGPWAIFANCFTGTKDFLATSRVTKALAAYGYSVLRFDYTGLGESDGAFEATTFSSNISDLQAAAAFLSEYYHAPSLLIGHSLGGAATLFSASKIPSVKAVVTLNAPCNPQHVVHHFEQSMDEINAKGYAEITVGGRSFRVGKPFVDDLKTQSTTEALADFQAALLVCHTPADLVVGVDQAAQIFSHAKHPKSFLSLGKADHLLTKKEDCLYIAKVIQAWAAPYLAV